MEAELVATEMFFLILNTWMKLLSVRHRKQEFLSLS